MNLLNGGTDRGHNTGYISVTFAEVFRAQEDFEIHFATVVVRMKSFVC